MNKCVIIFQKTEIIMKYRREVQDQKPLRCQKITFEHQPFPTYDHLYLVDFC